MRIDGALDTATAARWWQALRGPAADGALARIDLSSVTEIDSSGVALLQCLSALAEAAGRPAPEVVGAPAHYAQILLAHRVEAGGD